MALKREAAAIWVGVQSAKGTPQATMRKKLSLIGGGLSPKSESAMKKLLDGKRFGRKISFKKQTMVGGELELLATPEDLAFLESCVLANDAVSGDGPYEHAMDTTANDSKWLTFIQRIGTGSQLIRDRYLDCRVVDYEIEGSASSDDPVTVKATVIGLSVQTGVASDPVPTETSVSEPYTWTDIAGAFEVEGTAYRNISQLSLRVATGEELHFTDDIVAHDVVSGEPVIEYAGTFLVDAQGLALWNQLHYGSATPATDTGISTEDLVTDLAWAWSYGAGADLRSAAYTLNKVTLSTDDEITPSAEGGPAEISIAGSVSEADDGSAAMEVVHTTDDATVY